jgi:signal transduction histidine kinase
VFLRDKAIHAKTEKPADMSVFIDHCFNDFLKEIDCCAGFLCLWREEQNDFVPIVSHKIPIAPFKGARKESLKIYIDECLRVHPSPHVHSVAKSKLWDDIASLTDVLTWHPKSIFIPVFLGDLNLIIICFTERDDIGRSLDLAIGRVSYVAQVTEFILSARDLKNRVKIMELYVREIGHDIASSVQAIISKLRNVSRGIVEGAAAKDKIRQAEDEIMATYRVADTLGITVDPDYNISNGELFNLQKTVLEVCELCSSEAGERHIEFIIKAPETEIELWGDYKAIQSACMQIVMNAIKYSRGSTDITIRINSTPDSVEIAVTDRGLSLNPEDEAYVWEFGWRGNRAKELHVNGSGIGLYTVKKIVNAHGGSVYVKATGKNNEVVTFGFRIPKPSKIKKYQIKIKST